MKSLKPSANRKSFGNTCFDGALIDDFSSPVSINSIARPNRKMTADEDEENVANSDDEDDIPTLKYVHSDISDISVLTVFASDAESLKRGIIKTSKNKANKPYTILLVGETGVGKSSVLELIANVLIGNDIDHYDFNILDRTNEQGGSDNQSQTNSARLYQFTSQNGIVVSAGAFE